MKARTVGSRSRAAKGVVVFRAGGREDLFVVQQRKQDLLQRMRERIEAKGENEK